MNRHLNRNPHVGPADGKGWRQRAWWPLRWSRRRAVRRFATTLANLEVAGSLDGGNAAAWWQQHTLGGATTVAPLAAQILAGLCNLNPQVLDTLPGVAVDDSVFAQIYTEHACRGVPGWRDLQPRQRIHAVDTYRDAYETALHDQVATYCRQLLDQHPATPHTETPSTPLREGGVR